MSKEELLEKITTLLDLDGNLDFLLTLKQEELERLLALIRARFGQGENV